MKKLTKVLSLVLVVAMVFGLCVVGAGATYSDSDKITDTYKEAAEIMSDLGVISGTGNNAFNPTGELTRAEAAVILAKVSLGAQAAYIAPNTVSFKDVPTSYWGYKYIEYCVNAGLLSGTGNGNFSPNAKLDGYQWALMLMRARGLNPDDYGISGANWAINTATAYYGKAKFSAVPISASVMTREAAIQMAYDATFTAVDGKYGYTVKDKTTGKVVAVYDTLVEAAIVANLIQDYEADGTQASMGGNSMAKRVFGVTRDSGVNTYGQASNVYKTDTAAQAKAYGWNVSTFSTQAKTVAGKAAVTFTTKFTAAAAGLALKNAGYTASVDSNDATVTVVTNGIAASEKVAVSAAITTAVAASGNGVLVEFYVNASNVIDRVVIVDTKLGKITARTLDNAATTTIDERDLTVKVADASKTVKVGTPGFEEAYAAYADALAAKTSASVLIVFDANNKVLSVAVPQVITVEPTSYVADTSFVAGGTTYKYSKNVVGTVNGFASQSVVLDQYGYVISAPGANVVNNYAVVLGVQSSITLDGTVNSVRLLMPDGTTRDVTSASAISGTEIGKVATYTVSNNVYTITVLTAGDGIVQGGTGTTAIKTGTVGMTLNGATVSANANTIFLVKTENAAKVASYAAYRGINNVPSITSAAKVSYVVTSGYAAIVYVDTAIVSGGASTITDIIFVDKSSETASVINTSAGAKTVYVYDAVVNGTVTKITTTTQVTADAIFGSGTVDPATGYYTALNAITPSATIGYVPTATGIENKADMGLVKFGNVELTYNDDTAVFYIDANGTISAVGAGGVTTDTNDTVTYYTTNGVLTFAVVTYVAPV